MNQQTVDSITIMIIALICIYISGIFFYLNDNHSPNNPIFRAFGWGFIGFGGLIIMRTVERFILPEHLYVNIKNMRQN